MAHDHHQHHDHGSHGHGHHHQHPDFDSPAMADHAELEGEVLSGLVEQAIATVAELAERDGLRVERVVDLGCGAGVASCHLARRFPAATVVAVDGSAAMLERARARVGRLDLAEQVQVRPVELPAGLDDLGRAEVAWASMVLHHLGDEVDALRRIRQLLAPGGLLALVEAPSWTRVLVDDADATPPGLGDRLDDASTAWFARLRAELAGRADIPEHRDALAMAGFEVLVDEGRTVELAAPLDDRVRRFAHRHLSWARDQLADDLDQADLRALDALLEPEGDGGILHRTDVALRVTRHLYVARA